jgi:hypothetical protein
MDLIGRHHGMILEEFRFFRIALMTRAGMSWVNKKFWTVFVTSPASNATADHIKRM